MLNSSLKHLSAHESQVAKQVDTWSLGLTRKDKIQPNFPKTRLFLKTRKKNIQESWKKQKNKTKWKRQKVWVDSVELNCVGSMVSTLPTKRLYNQQIHQPFYLFVWLSLSIQQIIILWLYKRHSGHHQPPDHHRLRWPESMADFAGQPNCYLFNHPSLSHLHFSYCFLVIHLLLHLNSLWELLLNKLTFAATAGNLLL